MLASMILDSTESQTTVADYYCPRKAPSSDGLCPCGDDLTWYTCACAWYCKGCGAWWAE